MPGSPRSNIDNQLGQLVRIAGALGGFAHSGNMAQPAANLHGRFQTDPLPADQRQERGLRGCRVATLEDLSAPPGLQDAAITYPLPSADRRPGLFRRVQKLRLPGTRRRIAASAVPEASWP